MVEAGALLASCDSCVFQVGPSVDPSDLHLVPGEWCTRYSVTRTIDGRRPIWARFDHRCTSHEALESRGAWDRNAPTSPPSRFGAGVHLQFVHTPSADAIAALSDSQMGVPWQTRRRHLVISLGRLLGKILNRLHGLHSRIAIVSPLHEA